MQPKQIYITSGVFLAAALVAIAYYDIANMFKFDDDDTSD
jgi:hypothetical protein